MEETEFQKIRVLVETAERSFKGFLHKPRNTTKDQRLSDYVNSYGDKFLRLSEVEITDRGLHYRVGEKVPFCAVAVSAITYIIPLEGE
jgi:hypothetical protein